ncbi:MAG: protein-glutamate O-methyltransferase CheR, partial [Pseudomonadota bacterium]
RFFREPVHFDFLTKSVYPKLFDRENKNEHIRLWSAGCSTGEEPYTLAMTILKHLKSPANLDYDIKILGTDISTRVLQKAMAGIYSDSIMETVPESARNLFFKKIKREEGMSYHISEQIANMTTFRRFNLTETFPFSNKFNVIFCRNVMIYFDRSTQQSLIDKFFNSLKPGGHFFIGHSESLTAVTHQFKYIVPTIYQK